MSELRDRFGLAGKPALVVGGGFGIGRASALLLAQAGADVAVADLDVDRADDVVAEVEALGVRAGALHRRCHRSRPRPRGSWRCRRAPRDRSTSSINMVGTAGWASLLDLDDETWAARHLGRNLTQHLYVGRAAARQMIAAGHGRTDRGRRVGERALRRRRITARTGRPRPG